MLEPIADKIILTNVDNIVNTYDQTHDHNKKIELCMNKKILFNKLIPTAYAPTLSTELKLIGYNLYAPSNIKLDSLAVVNINSGISITLPYGHYGHILPYLQYSLKGVNTMNGYIVNNDEIIVTLINHSKKNINIDKGAIIGHFIIGKSRVPSFTAQDLTMGE